MVGSDSIKNLLITLFIFLGATLFAIFGYNFSSSVLGVSDLIVTSISIIFGLCLALLSLVSSNFLVSDRQYPDNFVRLDVSRFIAAQDKRTVVRQKWSLVILLATVIFGILFAIIAESFSEFLLFKIFGAIFSFFAFLSFSIAFLIPFSLASMIERNRDLGPPESH
jgi:hypothetical protein